jgi:lysophospholipase L1-like esterase
VGKPCRARRNLEESQAQKEFNLIWRNLLFVVFLLFGGTAFSFGQGNPVTIAPNDPRIQYSGRVDFTDPQAPRFDWPKVTLTAAFTGKGIGILLEDGGNNYNVYIDGKLHQVLVTKPGAVQYDLKDLSESSHLLQLVKRTEASWGMAVFKGLVLEKNGALEEPPALPKRRIEIIGDSISCGYGNEGSRIQCDDLRPYQNSDRTYGAFLARDFGAECRIIAISGKGVVRNWGAKDRTSPDPLPPYYRQTLAGNPDLKWDFKLWVPDAVLVFLGTNDFSTSPQADPADFISSYRALLQAIRKNYPRAQVFCLGRSDLPNLGALVEKVAQAEAKKTGKKICYIAIPAFDYRNMGCDGHPKVETHRELADFLAPVFSKTMKWDKKNEAQRPSRGW